MPTSICSSTVSSRIGPDPPPRAQFEEHMCGRAAAFQPGGPAAMKLGRMPVCVQIGDMVGLSRLIAIVAAVIAMNAIIATGML